MKTLSILLLCATFFLAPQSGSALQINSSETAIADDSDTEADIKAIRAEYNRINGLKLKPETFTYKTQDSVEGGAVSYYTAAAGQIVKVSEQGAMDDAVWRREYYYKDGQVCFCFETLNWGAAAGPTITTEYRFYIKDGRSIREMSDKKIEALNEKSQEAIARAAKWLEVKGTKAFASVYCL
ncbi:MAG: hypothetical protein EOP49_53205 [Sphingobacteriales bacterium]|nr:MAG: hypothetical protein EOP49_53205 [Sphingobacteriales bacterium]